METGEVPDPHGDWTRNFMSAMADVNARTVRASVTAAEYAHPRPDRVLDVAGGPGTFAREFARRGANITLFDQAEVIEVVEPLLDATPVETVAGDMLESLPSGFDLAFCSRTSHMFGPEGNRTLFSNCFEVLDPGGTVVCTDFVHGRSERTPVFAVNMLAHTERGDTYSAERYREWLADAGFEDSEIRDIPGTDLQAIIGHQPE